MLEMFRKKGFRGSLVTNAQDERGVSIVCKFPDVVNHVLISIEGHTPELNSLVRGRGSFEKVLKSISTYKKNGIRIHTRTVINKHNHSAIQGMFKFALKYGVSRLTFSTIQPNMNTLIYDLDTHKQDLKKVYNEYKAIKERYPNIPSGFTAKHFTEDTKPKWDCHSFRPANEQLLLMPDGKVSVCCDLADFYFDQDRFQDIKNNEKYDHIVGDISVDSLGDVLNKRRKLYTKLKARRKKDAGEGALTGARKYFCENCKFYFYK